MDILMSSDIVAVQMSTKAITLDRAQSGWLFRKDRSELIGAFRVCQILGCVWYDLAKSCVIDLHRVSLLISSPITTPSFLLQSK